MSVSMRHRRSPWGGGGGWWLVDADVAGELVGEVVEAGAVGGQHPVQRRYRRQALAVVVAAQTPVSERLGRLSTETVDQSVGKLGV
jgi:hypothetical protein